MGEPQDKEYLCDYSLSWGSPFLFSYVLDFRNSLERGDVGKGMIFFTSIQVKILRRSFFT